MRKFILIIFTVFLFQVLIPFWVIVHAYYNYFDIGGNAKARLRETVDLSYTIINEFDNRDYSYISFEFVIPTEYFIVSNGCNKYEANELPLNTPIKLACTVMLKENLPDGTSVIKVTGKYTGRYLQTDSQNSQTNTDTLEPSTTIKILGLAGAATPTPLPNKSAPGATVTPLPTELLLSSITGIPEVNSSKSLLEATFDFNQLGALLRKFLIVGCGIALFSLAVAIFIFYKKGLLFKKIKKTKEKSKIKGKTK